MAGRSRLFATVALSLSAACAEAPSLEPGNEPPSAPDVVRLVCEADGTSALSSLEVKAQPDGVHLEVENRFEEPVSVGGFDADPGVSAWTLEAPPGPFEVMCWPFSEHTEGEEPTRLSFQVIDPEGLYVPAVKLECEVWSSHGDYASPPTGVADDPIGAARRSLTGLDGDDELSIHRSGYPEARREGSAIVVVSRDGQPIAIVGAVRADDGRWIAPNAEGCVEAGIDIG